MFDKTLKFFIENYKINYILFFLIIAAGIFSYTKIPKEVSPNIEPNSVTIRGRYAGASINALNKMAVVELEDDVSNIDGVTSVSSIISPGRFSIVLELEKGADKDRVTDDVKDAISLAKSNLPSDMDEPTVRSVAHSRSLMFLAVLSDKLPMGKLKEVAKKFKSKLISLKDISDITIFGDSDLYYEILFDENKIRAYGLSLDEVLRAISELSYIYPVGKIEDVKKQYYLSTENGKKLVKDLDDTILIINNKRVKLKDIATVKKRYADSSTLASMNGKNSITLAISQNPKGDAIRLAKKIKKILSKMKIKGVEFRIRRDQSVVIKDRLNIVISNILFGIILITALTTFLINFRMAFIIALGIPTSFVMGAIYFYLTGYSININSLIGVLIAIGIIVDDAIVVSENIQQYIEKGFPPKEAAYLGTKEMAKPVVLASLTTLFAFIPLLMIEGRLGEIIRYIPIAFSVLVVASLIESFIFLPIHAAHILTPNSKTLSWERVNRIYEKILRLTVKYQKSFLLIFIVLVPLLTYVGIKKSRFQMFQPFDATSVDITFKAVRTTTLDESLKIIQTIEKDLLKNRKKFFIKDVSSTAGYRRSATGRAEMYPYVGYISIELYKKKPSNFVDKYITPYLSFYYDKKDRIRDVSSQKISREIRGWLRKKGYKKRFHLNNLMVVERRMGHVRADIRIGVISSDYQKAMKGVRVLEKEFSKIKGIKYFGDNIKIGTEEIKLKINPYGEKLGITERYLGNYLANIYLSRKAGVIFDNNKLLDIKTQSVNKDNLDNFKSIKIPLKDGSMVPLKDICTFEKVKSLERLIKDDGETTFYVFANVNPNILTSGEAMKKIKPVLAKLKKEGLRFKLRGEAEQKRSLESSMILASALAITLIFISILYMFNSIRETLIIMSVIPFSFLGVFIGHFIMGLNLSLPSLIGALGLAGVIVNDGIIMMATIKTAKDPEDIFPLAAKRFRPIILTSVTTILGLTSLIFFASGQAATFQPMAVTLGFGLLWGTILNLIYLPTMYNFLHRYKIISQKRS